MATQNEVKFSWMIVALCSGLFFLAVGLFKVQGLLFVETMHHFQIDREKASLAFFLSSILRSFVGPIAGYLGHTFGLQIVIFTGVALSYIGMVACYFTNDIIQIYIFWGGLVGVGCGLLRPMILQVINSNFRKHFSKALGLVFAAVSIGAFIIAPVTEMLLKTFGLSGTFLILGGIMLHGIPLALMLKTAIQLEAVKKVNAMKNETIAKEQFNTNDALDTISDGNAIAHNSVGKKQTVLRNVHGFNAHNFPSKHNKILVPHINNPDLGCGKDEQDFKKSKHLDRSTKTSDDITLDADKIKASEECFENSFLRKNNEIKCLSQTMDKKSLAKNRNHLKPNTSSKQRHPLRVFLNISYIIIAFNYGYCYFLTFVIPTVIVDYVLDKGMTRTESTYLLMAISGSDIFFRLTFGWIIDREFISRSNLCAISFFLSALSFLCTVWSTSFVTIMMSLILHAMSLTLLLIGIPGVISHYIEKDLHTMAIASSSFFLVPFNAAMPSLIGYFRDDLESYDLFMYFLAAVSVFGGTLLFILPYVENWRTTKKEIEAEVQELCMQ